MYFNCWADLSWHSSAGEGSEESVSTAGACWLCKLSECSNVSRTSVDCCSQGIEVLLSISDHVYRKSHETRGIWSCIFKLKVLVSSGQNSVSLLCPWVNDCGCALCWGNLQWLTAARTATVKVGWGVIETLGQASVFCPYFEKHNILHELFAWKI